jgi:hypothetical protein
MRSFEQVFEDQKTEKTPVNKGQNDFSPEKSPTSFGEEPQDHWSCRDKPGTREKGVSP